MPTIEETEDKIRGFVMLPDGWHYGEGRAPSKMVIYQALLLCTEARSIGFDESNAFPGIEGEIMITFYLGTTYLELSLENNGTITFVHEEDTKEIKYEEGLSFDEVVSRLEDFKWAISAYYTTNTTTLSEKNLKAMLLKIQAAMAASLSSTANAPSLHRIQYASTYKGSIRIKLMIQHSSGRYQTPPYSPNASPFNKTVRVGTNAISTYRDLQTVKRGR